MAVSKGLRDLIMPSLRSRLLLVLLRNRHIFKLRMQRQHIDKDTSIERLRAKSERAAAAWGGAPKHVRIKPDRLNAIPTEWIIPVGSGHRNDEQDTRTLLYFHGGGYVMGSLNSHRGVVAKFVRESGIRALHFDYRKAPEHPYPAALDDALAAYQGLLSRGVPNDHIVFLGDSAGGGLCLAALIALRDRSLPLPAAACALSPWTDLKGTGASYAREDDLAPAGSWPVYAGHYAGTHALDTPLISPLYADLKGLPPLFLCVGDRESMADDSLRFAAKAQAAGVSVRLLVGKGLFHCYPIFSPLFPEAQEALRAICQYIETTLPDRVQG